MFYPFASSKGLAPCSIKMLFLQNCDLIPHLHCVFYKTKYSAQLYTNLSPPYFSSLPSTLTFWMVLGGGRSQRVTFMRLMSRRLWCSFSSILMSFFFSASTHTYQIHDMLWITTYLKTKTTAMTKNYLVISEFLLKGLFPLPFTSCHTEFSQSGMKYVIGLVPKQQLLYPSKYCGF